MICNFCSQPTNQIVVKSVLYHHCDFCHGIFKDPSCFCSPDDQKNRYEKHNNTLENQSYKKYLQDYLQKIDLFFQKQSKQIGCFLDFGSGVFPAMEALLKEENNFKSLLETQIFSYDIFFANYPKILEKKFDGINCLEVAEHFENPLKEFSLLYKLCKEDGYVIVSMQFVDFCDDFSLWWYKEDSTHVSFYSKKSLQILAKRVGFSSFIEIDKNIIALKKCSDF
ncbi:MAG: class I SAM-dependent methyltransferase [Treponemataceae bacterium]